MFVEYAERLRPKLEEHADVTLIDFDFQSDLTEFPADFAIVLGGDGSILRAVNQMGEYQIPVLGVNLGKLGFLADLSPDEAIAVIPNVCRGHYRTTEQLLFNCQVTSGDRAVAQRMGLNEVAILGGPPYSILDVELYVDGELVTTYSCDGLIVSTPVGSTAHSLSAGGPILRKDLEAFVICPVSPHTLTMRPVVDSADRTYEMAVREPLGETSVVVDGFRLYSLSESDRVRVVRAAPRFRLIEVEGHSYYRTLREKLGWGGSIRSRQEGI